jgi:hypothetical protein
MPCKRGCGGGKELIRQGVTPRALHGEMNGEELSMIGKACVGVEDRDLTHYDVRPAGNASLARGSAA